MKSISQDIKMIQKSVRNLQTENGMTSLRSWISPIDVSTDLQHALRKLHDGTGSWFLNGKMLERWKNGTSRHLWLNGIPGSGKTILCSTIVDNISQKFSYPLLYFFYNGSDTSKQSVDKIVRSLIFQLYTQSANCQKELDVLFESVTKDKQPSLNALFTTFQDMIKNLERCFIIIDALDECGERAELLKKFQTLGQNDAVQFIFYQP